MEKKDRYCGVDCTACGGGTQNCTDALIERAEAAESALASERKETERLRELLLWAEQRFRRAIVGLPVRDADELIAAIEKAALQERQGEE